MDSFLTRNDYKYSPCARQGEGEESIRQPSLAGGKLPPTLVRDQEKLRFLSGDVPDKARAGGNFSCPGSLMPRYQHFTWSGVGFLSARGDHKGGVSLGGWRRSGILSTEAHSLIRIQPASTRARPSPDRQDGGRAVGRRLCGRRVSGRHQGLGK